MSKTDPPGRDVMKVREGVTSADCANDPEPTPRGQAAERTSAIGLSLLPMNDRHGSESSHLLLSCPLPLLRSTTGRTSSHGAMTDLPGWRHRLIYSEFNSHSVGYGTWPRSGFLTSGRSWDQTLTRFISGS